MILERAETRSRWKQEMQGGGQRVELLVSSLTFQTLYMFNTNVRSHLSRDNVNSLKYARLLIETFWLTREPSSVNYQTRSLLASNNTLKNSLPRHEQNNADAYWSSICLSLMVIIIVDQTQLRHFQIHQKTR